MAEKKLTSAPGATEVASWQNQVPKVGATVSGSPQTTLGANADYQYIYSLKPQQRQIWANALKKAGYKVPTSGAYSEALASAYVDAISKAEYQATLLGKTFDPQTDFSAYLDQRATEVADLEAAGGDGIDVVRQRRNLRPETVEATIDEVYRDLLGRGATAAERKKYSSKIQNALSKTENMATTRYVDVGGGVQEQVISEGFSPQAFLYEQIAQGDEAKQQRVLSFYDAFKKTLGVR